MPFFAAPIVGSFFRKPAPAIIANLPSGTPLRLEAEPDNPHDPNAIKVIIDAEHLPHNEELEAACVAQGTFPEDLYAAASWHIGYIDAKAKKTNSAARLLPHLEQVISVTLGTHPLGGYPMAELIFAVDINL
jgi:hypothetical protein